MESKDSNNNDRRKIILIIPNLGNGGAQKVFRQQFESLSKSFDVTGCVFNWDGSFPQDITENIFSLNVPAGKSYLGKAYYFILRIIRLRRLKRDKQIQISISHLEGADYVNILSRKKDKVICWIHGTKKFDENINGTLGILRMKILIPWLYKRADRIVTVSKGIEVELSQQINKIDSITQTIFNGFNIEEIVSLSNHSLDPELYPLFQQSKVIITHCRLARQKNLDALITIFSNLKNRNKVKLVIVGDGELRDELITTCLQLELKSWTCWNNKAIDYSCDIFFIGQQQNPFKFLRLSKLFMMTSDWEGFPLALGEAMVCGLPVIVSDCFTGPREIFAPENYLPQPIQFPCVTQYGVLMPLADSSDQDSVKVWIRETEAWLSKIDSPDFHPNAGIDRIRQFSLSESMHQTINLLRDITEKRE